MKKKYEIPEAEELRIALEIGLLTITGGDDDIPHGVMPADEDSFED